MLSLVEDLEDRMNLREKLGDIRELIKVLGFLLIIAHFFACAWHYVAVKENENGALFTWLGEPSAFEDEWINRYVTSLYYSVVTMSTLGYGDITPKTPSN